MTRTRGVSTLYKARLIALDVCSGKLIIGNLFPKIKDVNNKGKKSQKLIAAMGDCPVSGTSLNIAIVIRHRTTNAVNAAYD